MELDGRHAVVVGAASGVGRGAAGALAAAGMRVVAADIDVAGVRDLAVSDASGGIHPAHVDATDRESLVALRDDIDALWGAGAAVDLLVVTVGVIDSQPVDEITKELWAWAWNVNVMAPIRAVETFLPVLRRSTSPRIVLTGSGSGLMMPDPDPHAALYNTTKRALTGFSETLREWLRPLGVGVTLLVPSGVVGQLARNSAASRARCLSRDPGQTRGGQPAGRVLLPATELGELLVAGLKSDRDYVSNRGGLFADEMTKWIDRWRAQTE